MNGEDMDQAVRRWNDYVSVQTGTPPQRLEELRAWVERGEKAIAESIGTVQESANLNRDPVHRFYEWTEEQTPIVMSPEVAFDFGAMAGLCIGLAAEQFHRERKSRAA